MGNAMRRIGLGALTSALSPRDNVRITLSHFVADEDVENFKRLLALLLSDRQAITPQQLFRYYTGGKPIRGKSVLLTFDDGLLSSFKAAQDVLNPLGVKAIFFVPTQIFSLKTKDEMRTFFAANVYRRSSSTALGEAHYVTMTLDHVHELHSQGHMVLPHTHSHADLTTVKTAALMERELHAPKCFLEDVLQAPAEGFAFPFGNERVVDALPYNRVKELYSLCFTGLNGINSQSTDCFYLRRDCVHPYYSEGHVSNILAGSYDLFYALKMRRLRRRTGGKDAP